MDFSSPSAASTSGAAGLLVPVRDPAGRVVALLSRRDDARGGGGKYSYLSSAKYGGPGPGAPPHVPLGIEAPAQTIRLTEGTLKADIAFALSGLPTVGAAGLAWRPALDVLRELGGKTARLAFDADALDNAHVARALSDCCEAAAAAGLAVELERWDKADGKGIDDLLAAGKAPEVLAGDAARDAISKALAAATAGEHAPEPGELERLADVLATEGAAGLFRDKKLLKALAALSVNDPPEYANRAPIVCFYVPAGFNWQAVRNHPADGRLGEFITLALRETAKLNPELQGVLDVKDFNERQAGQRILDEDRLAALVEVISRHRLGLTNTAPDVLGQAYEYLLRKFAEGQGQSAGEFYTPMEVGRMMAEVLNPRPRMEVYDCACGSGGLLVKTRIVYRERHPTKTGQAPKLYGQELNPATFAMARMNMVLHGDTDARIALGDTFRTPSFSAPGAGLKQFDYVIANPMWNQDNYDESFYENDTYRRFGFGTPPRSSADWGWLQHILASLNETGRAAVVLDTGAVSRGSGSKQANKEREIRKAFVENDLIEGVILLPENLFYNTTAPGVVIVLARDKPAGRKGQILLVNASAHFRKEKPKNVLTEEGIRAVSGVFQRWENRPKLSRVITLEEARAADYNLSSSQFVEVNDRLKHRLLAEILADMQTTQAEREKADTELRAILAKLSLNGEIGE